AKRPRVEEGGHRGDIILVEDGHILQKSLIRVNRVAILGRVGGPLHHPGSHRDLRNELSERKCDGQGRELLLNLDRSQRWLKSLLQNLNGVISLRNSFEAKSAGGIRLDRRKRFRAAFEGNRRVGHRSAAGIDNRPHNWQRAGLALSQGAKQRNKTEKQE